MAKGIGHNSTDPELIRSYAERIERVMDEVQILKIDISELYSAAKQEGLDPKLLRKAIKKKLEDREAKAAEEAALETYLIALGVLADTPLGQAALENA